MSLVALQEYQSIITNIHPHHDYSPTELEYLSKAKEAQAPLLASIKKTLNEAEQVWSGEMFPPIYYLPKMSNVMKDLHTLAIRNQTQDASEREAKL